MNRPVTDVTVRVRVPATSANLGPGYDSLGLALDLYDEIEARTAPSGVAVEVTGEGVGELPSDETHLVVRAMYAAFDQLGGRPPGLALRCVNRIPHARGLGSSSAAIVGGILAARTLAAGGLAAGGPAARGLAESGPAARGRADRVAPVAPVAAAELDGVLGDGAVLDGAAMLRLASGLEGHPDNVAPCLWGGFTIAWTTEDGAHAVRLEPSPAVRPVVFVPEDRTVTAQVRGLLPERVPHVDAVANVGRAALLVHALTRDPSLLLAATADRLHQDYRAPAMEPSAALVRHLRAAGVPAVISGAGPSVLALVGVRDDLGGFAARGFVMRPLAVAGRGAEVSGG